MLNWLLLLIWFVFRFCGLTVSILVYWFSCLGSCCAWLFCELVVLFEIGLFGFATVILLYCRCCCLGYLKLFMIVWFWTRLVALFWLCVYILFCSWGYLLLLIVLMCLGLVIIYCCLLWLLCFLRFIFVYLCLERFNCLDFSFIGLFAE